MPLRLADLQPLFGLEANDERIDEILGTLGSSTEYDQKIYPDATYRNYYSLGLSLCFLKDGLDSIDIFNPSSDQSTTGRKKGPTYAPPPDPLVFDFADAELVLPARKAGEKEVRVPRPQLFEVTLSTSGREIVRRLGEPARKGAGSWLGVWLEWTDVRLRRGDNIVSVGIMLELKDPKGAEGMTEEQKKAGMGGLWDQAANWRWGSIKLFRSPVK